jgi:hypothetical protein
MDKSAIGHSAIAMGVQALKKIQVREWSTGFREIPILLKHGNHRQLGQTISVHFVSMKIPI